MGKYKIADLIVDMTPKYGLLSVQAEPYRVDDRENADITIDIPHEFLVQKVESGAIRNLDECEYSWYGFEFYRRLLDFDGMLLHSSCISVDGMAYMFSAPSGTGKSTHTRLWKQHFGERAVYINDDKPALIIRENKVLAYGTPFSGKTDLNTNISSPVKAICILSRGEENSITRAETSLAVHKILNQSYRPTDPTLMLKLLDTLDKVVSDIPVYDLKCNISDQAVVTAYEYINKN